MTAPKAITDRIKLVNGVEMPCLGFGTFKFKATHEMTYTTLRTAAEAGYRLIDTASLYSNERGIGRGLRESGIPREAFFVASKVWNQDHGYDSTIAAVEESLEDLGFDYIDLYMIHWPIAADHDDDWREQDLQTWRALETLYRDGKIRAIGVSNFLEHHLRPLMEKVEIPIMVNELEISIGYHQQETREFCMKNGIQPIAYTPIGGVRAARPEMRPICEKYGKTPQQICLRWVQQLSCVPIPSTYNRAHMLENLEIFDFQLTDRKSVV